MLEYFISVLAEVNSGNINLFSRSSRSLKRPKLTDFEFPYVQEQDQVRRLVLREETSVGRLYQIKCEGLL